MMFIRISTSDLKNAILVVHIAPYVFHHFVETLYCLAIGLISKLSLLFEVCVA